MVITVPRCPESSTHLDIYVDRDEEINIHVHCTVIGRFSKSELFEWMNNTNENIQQQFFVF